MVKNNDVNLLLPYIVNEIKFLKAFHPQDKEIRQWLIMYYQGLLNLLGISQSAISDNKFVDSQNCIYKTINTEVLKFRFVISNDERSFSIEYTTNDFNSNCWKYEYDHKYNCELSKPEEKLFKANGTYTDPVKKLGIGKPGRELIKVAADRLIFHPASHIHIDHFASNFPTVANGVPACIISPHEIRICASSNNIFLHLFQLRYQFCIFNDKREREKERIIDLLEGYIKNKTQIRFIDLLK